MIMEKSSPAMFVQSLISKAGITSTIGQTPIENDVFAIIDTPSPIASNVGNAKYFSVKIKTDKYQAGYKMMKELEEMLFPVRNIESVDAGTFASFSAIQEPRIGGYEEGDKGKYVIIYQDYITYNTKPR